MSDGPRGQSYKLGVIFVILAFWQALGNFLDLFEGRTQVPNDAISLALNTALALTAAARTPWAWHPLLGGLLGRFVLGIAFAIIWIRQFGWPPLWALATGLLLMPMDLLWFFYFYRRRAMFGAQLRWRWIERVLPALVGPDVYGPQPNGITLAAVGVFGLSRRATILLAIAGTMALV